MKALPLEQRRIAYQFMLDPQDIEFLEYVSSIPDGPSRSYYVRQALKLHPYYQMWLRDQEQARKEQE